MESHCKTAAGRSKSYSLLSRFFLEKIDSPLLRELESALGKGLVDLDETFVLQAAIGAALDSPRGLNELQSDHARLLQDLAPEAECPDHVGVELRMMSGLCLDEVEAWRSGDKRNARAVLRQELRFLDEYVMPWLPGLSMRLVELTPNPCCLAMAEMTAQACRNHRDDIDSLLRGGISVLPWRAARRPARASAAMRAPNEGLRAVY
jgi:hypothetical protein